VQVLIDRTPLRSGAQPDELQQRRAKAVRERAVAATQLHDERLSRRFDRRKESLHLGARDERPLVSRRHLDGQVVDVVEEVGIEAVARLPSLPRFRTAARWSS
jgi:hypothetical protein